KPVVYGGYRLQEAVLPGIWQDVGQMATFPPSFLSEAYANFGALGLVFEPFVVGLFLRALYEKLRQTNYSPFYTLMSAFVIANTVNILRDFGTFLATFFFIGGLLYTVLLFAGLRLPPRSRAA